MSNSIKPLVCVDSSIVLPLVVEHPFSDPVLNHWQIWRNESRQFIAPSLLHYELVNVLHRYCIAGIFSQSTARASLEAALALPITLYDDVELHYSAGELAILHGFSATYDAHYLALAQGMKAEFWTADKRLYNSAHEALPWIHLL
ncbi:MAG: type II toxin-antitoxin system VapC family toxin [Anaerolineae bacterium]